MENLLPKQWTGNAPSMQVLIIAKRKAIFLLNVFLKSVYLGLLGVWMSPELFVLHEWRVVHTYTWTGKVEV